VYAPTETDKGGLETARHWVRLGATLHFLLWSVAGFLHNAPPLDIPEQLVWGSQWVLGTQKLPPLSSWMLEAAWQIGGMYGISMLAAGVSCTTYLLVFALGSRLMPVAQAGAGALLLSGVYYFSWPVPEFNHAMLQIPLWAAFFLVFHICLESRGRRPALAAWSALGAIFALALWAKYSSVLLGVTAGLWLLASAKGRAHLRTPGPWLGAAVAMIVIAPHLVWLVQADFSPLSYFEGRAGRGSTPLKFTVT
jgi:4-amino-4-deoxy-L-arabinose transferase-like glycosyltransferase